MLKKKLERNEKNIEYINSFPKVYLVATWAKTGVWELPFAGDFAFDKYAQCLVPLVYQYDDMNGTADNYYLRKITSTTAGLIIGWTFVKEEAYAMKERENARVRC